MIVDDLSADWLDGGKVARRATVRRDDGGSLPVTVVVPAEFAPPESDDATGPLPLALLAGDAARRESRDPWTRRSGASGADRRHPAVLPRLCARGCCGGWRSGRQGRCSWRGHRHRSPRPVYRAGVDSLYQVRAPAQRRRPTGRTRVRRSLRADPRSRGPGQGAGAGPRGGRCDRLAAGGRRGPGARAHGFAVRLGGRGGRPGSRGPVTRSPADWGDS